MSDARRFRYEAHLRAMLHVPPSEVPSLADWLDSFPSDEAKRELRALFRSEERFLESSGKVVFESHDGREVPDSATAADVRTAWAHLTELLHLLRESAAEGTEYRDLDFLCRAYARKYGLELPVLGHEGFPHALTVGIDGRIVHAPAAWGRFRRGDLVTLDTALRYGSGIADAAVAFVVGGEEADARNAGLVSDLRSILLANLPNIRAGVPLGIFSESLYDGYVIAGYRVVKNCNGHGVGRFLHSPPWVYHWPNSRSDATVPMSGEIITVEPIVTFRSDFVEYPDNGSVGHLPDGDVWAYWEFTLLVTETGPEILAGIP